MSRRYSITLAGKDGAGYKNRGCKEWDTEAQRYFTFHYPVENGVCKSCGKKVRKTSA